MAETCKAPDGSDIWKFGLDTKWTILIALVLGATPLLLIVGGPMLVRFIGRSVGNYLRGRSVDRKQHLLQFIADDEKKFKENAEKRRDSDEWENVGADATGSPKDGEKSDKDWDGTVGFFHPFCNAGGGGERVLWAAVLATQKRWPNAKCIIYTGDHNIDSKDQMVAKVKDRFSIQLHAPSIMFLYLTSRRWVLASTWPHFTLLGQSIGSIILAWDAFSLMVPDIFVDTMGYAFALGFCKMLFPDVPTGAYVHYPTISTDMLSSLDPKSPTGNLGVNAGKGEGFKGKSKRLYWSMFAKLYTWVGASIDVVMTNSNWTLDHITSLWGEWRRELNKPMPTTVYPPVAVEELEEKIDVSPASESRREPILLYIAQFRPEKNHQLILNSFAKFKATKSPASLDAKLVLIGSVRDDSDSKRVYELRLLANELKIKDDVEFHLDAPWSDILEWLGKASVGVNGMWNEHFGIGVVEYQAAGLISVVHDSGGPKRDIVTEIDGLRTGFHATTEEDFAIGFESALSLSIEDKVAMRLRARRSAQRFTEEEFAKKWIIAMEQLVLLRQNHENAGR